MFSGTRHENNYSVNNVIEVSYNTKTHYQSRKYNRETRYMSND